MEESSREQLRLVHGTRGSYGIEGFIGETKRARHFLAIPVGGGSRVLVKEWLPEVVAAHPRRVEIAERAYLEVERAGIPGLVGALDLFSHGGRRYLVTRYIEGAENPLAWCAGARSGRETQERVAYLLCELLRLIFLLHGVGHVHRDVHFLNVLVDREGRVYLIDLTEAVPLGHPEFDALASTGNHEAPGFEPPECLLDPPGPHGPAGDVWQVCAMACALLTGRQFGQDLETRARFRQWLPPDLDGGLLDVLSRGLNPNPDLRFTGPEVPLKLLSGVARRPGSPALARTGLHLALAVDNFMARVQQDLLPARTAVGLISAVVALAALGQVAADQLEGWAVQAGASREMADALWGGAVAAVAGVGAAGEALWRLDGRSALATAGKVGVLSGATGLLGMALGSVLFTRTVGAAAGAVDLQPLLLLLAWMLYGAGAGLGFGAGLLWARWLGVGRAAVMGGLLGGLGGGAIFIAFSEGILLELLGVGGSPAARFYGAASLFGVIAISAAIVHRRAAGEARLVAYGKGPPSEVVLPRGEPVEIGRRVGSFPLSWEPSFQVPDSFLRIERDRNELWLTVLARGQGLLNGVALEEGRRCRLHPGDWLAVGRRSLFHIEMRERKG